jgi:hypothetical protein
LANQVFDPNPNRISAASYQVIRDEREAFQHKQLDADCEFMYQHYERLLRALEVSFERATNANLRLERQERRKGAKERREALRGSSAS